MCSNYQNRPHKLSEFPSTSTRYQDHIALCYVERVYDCIDVAVDVAVANAICGGGGGNGGCCHCCLPLLLLWLSHTTQTI